MRFYFVLIFSLLIISCSAKKQENKKTESIAATEKTVIKFIGHWKNEGLREALLKDVAREFQFVNQQYVIEMAFPEDLYWDRSIMDVEQKFNYHVFPPLCQFGILFD